MQRTPRYISPTRRTCKQGITTSLHHHEVPQVIRVGGRRCCFKPRQLWNRTFTNTSVLWGKSTPLYQCSGLSQTTTSKTAAQAVQDLVGSAVDEANTNFLGGVYSGGTGTATKNAKLLQKSMGSSDSMIVRNEETCIILRISWDIAEGPNTTGLAEWTSRVTSTANPPPTQAPSAEASFVDDVFWMTSGAPTVDWCGPADQATSPMRPSVPCWRWFFELWGTHFPLAIDYGGVKSELGVVSASFVNNLQLVDTESSTDSTTAWKAWKIMTSSTTDKSNSKAGSVSEEEKAKFQESKQVCELGGQVRSHSISGWLCRFFCCHEISLLERMTIDHCSIRRVRICGPCRLPVGCRIRSRCRLRRKYT